MGDRNHCIFTLLFKGYDVAGVFLKNWDLIDEKTQCTGEYDWEHAQRTCEHLKIDLVQKDFIKQYWNNVFQ